MIRHPGSTCWRSSSTVSCTSSLIQGRNNPADFLTRKRFPNCLGPAQHTRYDEPDSALELVTASGAPGAACASLFVLQQGCLAPCTPISRPLFALRLSLTWPAAPWQANWGCLLPPASCCESFAARLRLPERATLPSLSARRPPSRARRASGAAAARRSRCTA